jgi:ribosomal protein L11 methyltransferase
VIRLAVRVARADAERVLAELLELVPGGLEERESGPDAVEYVIYGAPGEVPALPALRAAVGGALVDVSTSEVPDDWAERWRDWHQPVDVAAGGRAVRVRPPWEAAAPDALDVVIDPGQAFGTGLHPTTRLCLELLVGLEPGGALADWGAGSGVLAIAAARLGFAPIAACDVEPASLAAIAANAAANGVEGIAVSRVDLRREPGPWAPTVCANLVHGLLLEVAARMARPPRRLIASGLLHAEAADIVRAFAPHGLREARRADAGEWTALLLEA